MYNAVMRQTSNVHKRKRSYTQAMKLEDLSCASSIFGSRGCAKESKRKLSKPCYAKDFSWFLRFQFTFGRGTSIRRDKRLFSIDFYFFRSHFAEGVIAKYFHLTVFFRLAFSKRLFRLALRRKHTHTRREALINMSGFSWLAIASARI